MVRMRRAWAVSHSLSCADVAARWRGPRARPTLTAQCQPCVEWPLDEQIRQTDPKVRPIPTHIGRTDALHSAWLGLATLPTSEPVCRHHRRASAHANLPVAHAVQMRDWRAHRWEGEAASAEHFNRDGRFVGATTFALSSDEFVQACAAHLLSVRQGSIHGTYAAHLSTRCNRNCSGPRRFRPGRLVQPLARAQQRQQRAPRER